MFSVRVDGIGTPQDLSNRLETEHGLLTRSGLHCAPLAHRTMGTAQLGGTTRLSFGPFLQVADISRALQGLAAVARAQAVA